MKEKDFVFLLGATLLSLPCFILFIASLFFVGGSTLNSFIFPLGVISTLIFSLRIARSLYPTQNFRTIWLRVSIVTLLFIVLFLWIGSLFYDYSFDGQWYHQNIILSLKEGWNPIYQPHSVGSYSGIYVDHYSKGLETVWATVFCTTGYIESGKAISFLMITASLLLFYWMLSVQFRLMTNRKRVFISLLFTLNPVVLSQWFTYYVDWSLYTLLLSLVSVLTTLRVKDKWYKYFLIGEIIFFAASIKFNILFWIGVCILIYLSIMLWRKNYEILSKVILSGCIAIPGIVLASYNPYITNTIDHANPFYPLMGEGKVDIMTQQQMSSMKEQSCLEQVILPYFSYPQNDIREDTQLAIPFTIRGGKDLSPFISPDVSIAGFGPFFSGILILALLLYLFSRISQREYRIIFGIILISIFISFFILPSGWWARYVPFFGAFPLIMLLYCELDRRNEKWKLYLKRTVYGFIVLNLCIVGGMSIISAIYNNAKVDFVVSRIKEAPSSPEIYFGVCPSFKEKLKNVSYIEHTQMWEPLYFSKNVKEGVSYNIINSELGEGKAGIVVRLIDRFK